MGRVLHRSWLATTLWFAVRVCVLCAVCRPLALFADTNAVITCTVNIVSSPDTDGDGLPDVCEAWLGTDPAKADTDDDGMPDGWEVWNAFNPLDPVDGVQDADEDGSVNAHECGAGTDPRDPASVFCLTSITRTEETNVIVVWSSVTNRIYDVEFSSNLLETFWGKIASNIPGAVSLENSWTDSPPAEVLSPFYRVRAKR